MLAGRTCEEAKLCLIYSLHCSKCWSLSAPWMRLLNTSKHCVQPPLTIELILGKL